MKNYPIRRFIASNGISYRFWEISLFGNKVYVKWGPVGSSSPKARQKGFQSNIKAERYYNRLIKRNMREHGFIEAPVEKEPVNNIIKIDCINEDVLKSHHVMNEPIVEIYDKKVDRFFNRKGYNPYQRSPGRDKAIIQKIQDKIEEFEMGDLNWLDKKLIDNLYRMIRRVERNQC